MRTLLPNQSVVAGKSGVYGLFSAHTPPGGVQTNGGIVAFGTEDYDLDNLHTTGASCRYTAAIAGYYEFHLRLACAMAAFNTGILPFLRHCNTGGAAIRDYGGTVSITPDANQFSADAEANAIIKLAVGEWVEPRVFQVGAGMNNLYNNTSNRWQGRFIG